MSDKGQSVPQDYRQAALLAQPLSRPWSFDRVHQLLLTPPRKPDAPVESAPP